MQTSFASSRTFCARSFSVFALLGATVGASDLAQAAPTKAPATLSFAMTARLSYKDDGGGTPSQTIDARVQIAGQKARLETTLGGKPLIVLYSPPHVYRLLPGSKIGQKYRAGSLPQLANIIPGTDALTPDPKAIRTGLLRGGAKKTGTSVLGGVPVDVYSAPRFRNRPDKLTAYLRRSDSLPLRLLLDSKNFSAVASWRNYQVNRPLSAALFAVPKGYRIRNVDRAQ